MSSYVKATNFATKDTLPTGDSNKIVKGTEIDNELNAIAGAISSKSDIASPTFTGSPAAPTATAGSNTTQLANTAYVKQEITALALGNMSTQAKSAIDITGGTITGITDLAVADGGTGASTAANARTNLGLGSIATQNSNAVTITGGSVSGITDITVADGGTGASTAADARTNLGLGSIATQNSNSVSISGGTITGTYGLSITGNAATATNATNATTATNSTQFQGKTKLGLGITGEVWNNVTGSRALGTTYTNSRSYPIMVSASTSNSGPSPYIDVYVDGIRISYFLWQFNGSGAIGGTSPVVVPPGSSYRLDANAGLQNWVELY
jgi:hypothetical protein